MTQPGSGGDTVCTEDGRGKAEGTDEQFTQRDFESLMADDTAHTMQTAARESAFNKFRGSPGPPSTPA